MPGRRAVRIYGWGPGPLSTVLLCGFLAMSGCDSTPPATAGDWITTSESLPVGPGSAMPFLSSSGDTTYLSWLEPGGDDEHVLMVAGRTDGRWGPAREVARRSDFFVNWADFPSVQRGPDGYLWAHWLQRGPEGGYDYGIRVVTSGDGGATWSEPWTPHEDGTSTEHGFVSFVPDGGGMALTWLDGRRYERGPSGGPPSEEMTLRYRRATVGRGGRTGAAGPEELLDVRTCDCCQTDAVATPAGPVVVYRDRSPDEVRDIFVVRRTDEGWTDPKAVAHDGWTIPGCPVNGPSMVSRGDTVAVAWFSAAGDVPRVRLAYSFDGGATFGSPLAVAEGQPLGRVDLLLDDDGRVALSWLEQAGEGTADVRLRFYTPEGPLGPARTVATSGAGRSSGFPRLAAGSPSTMLVAWTDAGPDGVRTLRLTRLEESTP